MSSEYLWSTEQIRKLVDALPCQEDPAAFVQRVSLMLQVPASECQTMIDVLSSMSGKWTQNGEISQGRQKRFRRKAAAIERLWFCYIQGCSKSYGTENSLKGHFKHKHKSEQYDRQAAQQGLARRGEDTEDSEGDVKEEEDNSDDLVLQRPSKIQKVADAAETTPLASLCTAADALSLYPHLVYRPGIHMNPAQLAYMMSMPYVPMTQKAGPLYCVPTCSTSS